MTVHEDWCHSVVGCSEPGHCTCDAEVEYRAGAAAGQGEAS